MNLPAFLASLGTLPQISFGMPLILWALAALPLLWWLLRVTPPLPRRAVFPPLRLLRGLKDEEQTPAATPWWLLLLRLLAAALLIAALADPLLGRSPRLTANGPLVLVVDNGWTAAKDWNARQDLIADLLRSARGRPVAIIPTASPAPTGLLNEGEAARVARELKPMPWPGDRAAAAAALGRLQFASPPALYWLGDGLEGGSRALRDALARYGTPTIFTPARLAMGLAPVTRDASGFALAAVRAETGASQDIEAAAIGARGETLAVTKMHFRRGQTRAQGHIALPLEVRNATARLTIVGEDSAGAVQLLDRGAAQRSVGIVSEGATGEGQPLLSDVYYLERALSPYAGVAKGGIGALLDKHVSVLLLADVARIPEADRQKVKDFISRGGVLIRFAGERMAAGSDDLVPVPLRTGGRYLGSAMAWGAPQHLAPFASASPFNGLEIPGEVTVTRQILAEPSAELQGRTWAQLADGTPLITAQAMGQGWIVLFHITASPTWSSLPLSGLYVDMLKRLLALSAGTPARDLAGLTSLPPVTTLDGFGHPGAPPPDAAPIPARDFSRTRVSPRHPPGLYGAHEVESALNTFGAKDVLTPLSGGAMQAYGNTHALALEPWLLAAAMVLLLLDCILALGLRGFSPRKLRWIGAAFVLVLAVPQARADDAVAMKAALDTRLAYVKTGLADVDQVSEAGLTGLGLALRARTSYEPLEPIGVDLEHDDLSFYPLLYWPMDPREKSLSPAALARIGEYMRNGGTILFDTRDLSLGAVRGAASPGEQTLRRLTGTLDLPPLEPVPADHVLTKAFYILRDFPGRWTGGRVWVEALPPAPKNGAPPARGGDGVSPVIIGGNDWAAAWAVDGSGHFMSTPSPGGEIQREMAFRFGINLVMYALTGNYKTDVVHAPALLQRLGTENGGSGAPPEPVAPSIGPSTGPLRQ
ncbi:MAG TPA: DUF4159 domain-containing protein [Rhizomicrobium sp.]|nr:DUF4159 domain-containing protein [Rhizomicrobium sp.]